jgi:hypothetical protein
MVALAATRSCLHRSSVRQRLFSPVFNEALTQRVNVSFYWIDWEQSGTFYTVEDPAFVVCPFRFQVTPDSKVEDFLDDMYREVALTLINNKDRAPIPPGLTRENLSDVLENFISNTIIKSLSVTIGPLGGGGVSQAPNTSQAFERNGFRSLVQSYLRKIFGIARPGR